MSIKLYCGLAASLILFGCVGSPTVIKTKKVPCPLVLPDVSCPPKDPVIDGRGHTEIILDFQDILQTCRAAERARNRARADCDE